MSVLLSPVPYHLLAYGTFLGSQLYQSFINTKICYRSLPPQPFHNLNKRLWPVYFRCQLGLALLTAATKPGVSGSWLPMPAVSLSNVLLGVACTMAGLNWYTYGPRTSDAMVERANVLKETRENPAENTDSESLVQRVKKAFSRNHAMSIHFNLIAMIATVWYGFVLGGRLEVK